MKRAAFSGQLKRLLDGANLVFALGVLGERKVCYDRISLMTT